MADKKGEKIKIMVVVALSLILVISFYFRFIHTSPASPGVQQDPAKGRGEIPIRTGGRDLHPSDGPGERDMPGRHRAGTPEVEEFIPGLPGNLQTVVRDIFMPLVSGPRPSQEPALEEKKPEPSIPKPPPSFKLRGTIVGKESSIAIIDDRFLRQGDWIGEFQVAEIRKKDVLLDSGDRTIILEIMKNE